MGKKHSCSICHQLGHTKTSHKIKIEKMCKDCGSKKPIEDFYQRINSTTNKLTYSQLCKKHMTKNGITRENSSIFLKAKRLMYSIRARSALTNMECSITPEDICSQISKQNNKCYYTGKELVLGGVRKHSISVDRVDSNLGYTKDNIVVCYYLVNSMKNNLPLADFKNICGKVYYNLEINESNKESVII